jgi:hypothetical protein
MFWKFPKTFLPHYSLDLPHKVLLAADKVRAAFDLWHDDASRAEYVAQVRWRLHLDFDNLPPPVLEKLYFPADLIALSPDEVFVDCGAYDGDTIRDFLGVSGGRFRHIHAFEADQSNLTRLVRFVGGLPDPLRRGPTRPPSQPMAPRWPAWRSMSRSASRRRSSRWTSKAPSQPHCVARAG